MIRFPDNLLDAPPGRWVEWWVVFGDAPKRYWWTAFCRPGFEHCFALARQGGSWVQVDPGHDFMRVAVLPVSAYTPIHALVGDRTVVRVRASLTEQMRAPWIVGPLTCVEVVKSLLGIRSLTLLTPHQLYEHLRRHHGRS